MQFADEFLVQIDLPAGGVVFDGLESNGLSDEGSADISQSSLPLDASVIADSSLFPVDRILGVCKLAGIYSTAVLVKIGRSFSAQSIIRSLLVVEG